MTNDTCQHFAELTSPVAPTSDVCEQCVTMGDKWVHLRACLGCGQVGCCDNSKNRHARKHWETADHPVIRSAEPGETWQYCFPDGVLVR